MADITMCKGVNGAKICPVRHLCYRHTAKIEELGQSFFVSIPYNGTNCEYYWGDNRDSVFKDNMNLDDDVDNMEFKLNQD